MPRIRTTRQARALRRAAAERARQSHFHAGDRALHRGITWGEVDILLIVPRKPYNSAIFRGRSAAFIGSLADVHPVAPID